MVCNGIEGNSMVERTKHKLQRRAASLLEQVPHNKMPYNSLFRLY